MNGVIRIRCLSIRRVDEHEDFLCAGLAVLQVGDGLAQAFAVEADGGGKLEIAVAESTLLVDLVETYNNIYLDVTGVMATDGYVYELRAYKHRHGSINGNRTSITFTFEADDRLQMTFPALIWNNQNNRGNA